MTERNEISLVIRTQSIDNLISVIDNHMETVHMAKKCHAIGLARIEIDELYKQKTNPTTGIEYQTSDEFFHSPENIKDLHIPTDRKQRSALFIQGKAMLEAHREGLIDILDYNPQGKWRHWQYWSKACLRHDDRKDILHHLNTMSVNQFIAWASGNEEELSTRLNTSPKYYFQKYFLGLWEGEDGL